LQLDRLVVGKLETSGGNAGMAGFLAFFAYYTMLQAVHA